MRDLLRFEFRRLFLRTSLYVCIGVVLIPVIFMFIITAATSNTDGGNFLFFAVTNYQILSMMIGAGNLTTISIIFTSIFVCEDQARGTIKTIHSLGYSKFKLFFAKYIASASASVMMFLAVTFLGLICSQIYGKSYEEASHSGLFLSLYSAENEPDIYIYIVQQLTVILAVHSFYFLVAQMVQKTGLSIVLGIFLPGLISGGVGIIATMLSSIVQDNQVLAEKIQEAYMTFMMYWLPTNTLSISSLLSLVGSLIYPVSILVNIGYVIVFTGAAALVSYKKEIK